MFMRMNETHPWTLTGILCRVQIHSRCRVRTNMIWIKWCHHCFCMCIPKSCRTWRCSPWPWDMLREGTRLMLSWNMRPMWRSKLGKFSVVVQCRCIHRLNSVWSIVEPKPRIKSLHIPETMIHKKCDVHTYSKWSVHENRNKTFTGQAVKMKPKK